MRSGDSAFYAGVQSDADLDTIRSSIAGHTAFLNENVNVNHFLAMSELEFDNSGEPGPHAKEVNDLATPLRQLHVTYRASSCAKRGGHVQVCSSSKQACGIEPKTF